MSFISRNDTAALAPEDAVREIQQGILSSGSRLLPMMTKLRNMSRNTLRMPVLSALPVAYFVDQSIGDNAPGSKRTTRQAWENKYVTAAEIAVIVPLGQDVFEDVDYPIWDEVKGPIANAFGLKIDAAIALGTDAPTGWPTGIEPLATTAALTVTAGEGADVYDEILGESGLYAKVEDAGFMVRGNFAAIPMMAKLRGLRDENGQPIFVRNVNAGIDYSIAGVPTTFDEENAVDETQILMMSGDFSKFVWAWRTEMRYTVHTDGVIQDPDDGSILYNLLQQDMYAIRATMRLGWQYPNPVSRRTPTASERFPVGLYLPAAGSGSGS